MRYFTHLYDKESWRRVQERGYQFAGYKKGQRERAEKQGIGKGDYLLGYVTGISRWVGVLRVTGDWHSAVADDEYRGELFPYRIPIEPVMVVKSADGVSIHELMGKISIYQHNDDRRWTSVIRKTPTEVDESDAKVIVDAIRRVAGTKPTATRRYWCDIFSPQTWQRFRDIKGSKFTAGQRKHRRKIEEISTGDILLGYVTGEKRWVGVLEATGNVIEDSKPVFGADYPLQLPVKTLVELDVADGVLMDQFEGQLTS